MDENFIAIKSIENDIYCATILNYVILCDLNFKDKSIKINYTASNKLAGFLIKSVHRSCRLEKRKKHFESKQDFEQKLCKFSSVGLVKGNLFVKDLQTGFTILFSAVHDDFLINFSKTLCEIWPSILPKQEKNWLFFEQIKNLNETDFWKSTFKDFDVDYFYLENHREFLFFWLSLRRVISIEDEPKFD